MSKPKTPDHIAKAIIADWMSGMDATQAAAKHGIGRSTAGRIITDAGLSGTRPRNFGRECQVTEQMLLDAKAEGLTNAQAAARLGFTTQGISYACKKFGVGLRKAGHAEWAARQAIKARTNYVQDVTLRPAENDSLPHVPVHPIMATKGEWRALDAYAKARGLTYANAQKLWHKARVGQFVIA